MGGAEVWNVQRMKTGALIEFGGGGALRLKFAKFWDSLEKKTEEVEVAGVVVVVGDVWKT